MGDGQDLEGKISNGVSILFLLGQLGKSALAVGGAYAGLYAAYPAYVKMSQEVNAENVQAMGVGIGFFIFGINYGLDVANGYRNRQ